MGRSKKTVTKKTTASKKRTTKKSTEKKPAVKEVTENSSSEDPATNTPLDAEDPSGTAVPEEESEVKATRGEDVVILETAEGRIGFNTRDKFGGGKLVEMKLTRGLNKVPVSLFESFEEDEFFVEKILGGKNPVVTVVSRPGKSLDDVDI